MTRRRMAWWAAVVLLALSVAAAAQEAPPKPAEATPVAPADLEREQFGQALALAAERLAALQQPDGWWPRPAPGADLISDGVGRAALASAALDRSRGFHHRLEAEKAPAASERGLALIAQKKPQAPVDSAAMALQILCRWGRTRYPKQVDAYALGISQSQGADGPQAGAFLQPGIGAGRSTFFASIGLAAAARSGFQVPGPVWEKARAFLVATQHADGGWGPDGATRDAASTSVETFEGATALYVAEDALQPMAGDENSRPESAELVRALDATGKLLKGGHSPYGWFVLAQLAGATKRADLGGVDPRRLCVNELLSRLRDGKIDGADDLAFAMLAVMQDRTTVDIGKLRRAGDWETRRGDVRGFAEYLSDRFCIWRYWRVVTLDADVEALLKVPIFFVSGRNALAFTDAEKAKLKAYVDRGGTLWAEAVDGSAEFDKSFRALMAELWPGTALDALPREHLVFQEPRPTKGFKQDILALRLTADKDRLGVFYFPQGNMGVQWARVSDGSAPADAKPCLDAGVNVFYHVLRANEHRER